MFFLLYRRAGWRRFWRIFEDFRRFFKIVPKTRRTFPEIYRTFPKIFWRLPKIAEDDRRRSEDVLIIHQQIQPIQQKQKAGIVMSLNDTTPTEVTYGKYATRIPDEVKDSCLYNK